MAWRAARSLTTLHQQLRAGAPRAAAGTPASAWGLIGDALHDPTSDHAPKDFSGWGNDIVTAADFPNRPDLGLDARKVLDDIRRSRDPRVKYGISNGQIFSNRRITQGGRTYDAYEWRPYRRSDGSRYADEHYTHGHLSVVGDSRADGTQPWATIGAPAAAGAREDEDDMGASTGPIEIKTEGVTSLNIPPVQAGAADPRPAWLNLHNDTMDGEHAFYGLRIWISKGNGVFEPLPTADHEGHLALKSGWRFSVELPKGTSCISIMRRAVKYTGDAIEAITEPSASNPAYPGHLTLCVERGAVVKAP